ncbi:MAG: hypothetical protein ACLU7M_07880 [Mediterraneibacter gnavus]
MAGDRHGKHNTTTISFRVNSYEKATIEERVKVSGMKNRIISSDHAFTIMYVLLERKKQLRLSGQK